MDPHLSHLAEAIRNQSSAPGDPAGNVALKQALSEALQACGPDGASAAEALLSCLLETFTACGDQGKAVLDDMLLELLPPVARLAGSSGAGDKLLSAFCSLAAAACSPRDTITALLEVLDDLAQGSPGPDRLQFACNLLLMLPELVAKLSRRKAANAVECCCAAAALAQVHGQVLEGWMLNQMARAAQHAGGLAAGSEGLQILQRLDTFLAANWQAYVEFTEDMVKQVLQQETDADAQETSRQAISTLVLQLLQHLTGLWQPPALRTLAMQLLSGPGSAQLMPSSESVAPPTPVLASRDARQSKGRAAHTESDAEAAVLDLLRILQAAGVGSWQQLQSMQGSAQGGAGLAALYSACSDEDGVLAFPQDAVTAMQLACGWASAVVTAHDNNMLSILKAIALLQLASAHAKQLCTANSQRSTAAPAPPVQDSEQSSPEQQPSADITARQLLVDLQPCLTMLASVMSQAPAQVLRTQASLALQQLLQALPQPVCYACLQQLLHASGPAGGAVHPEVAALLLQEVRALLVICTTGSCFTPASCMQLAMPWLLQEGAVGWQAADVLPDRANAVCAALAVTRLVLLRNKAGTSKDAVTYVDRKALKSALTGMTAAVSEALQVLQTANSAEQGGAGSGTGSSVSDGRVCVPGEAQGAGQAVDAWLAVSRVQDVLDRVLELL